MCPQTKQSSCQLTLNDSMLIMQLLQADRGLVGLILYVSINSFGYVGMVRSPNHIVFLGKLDWAVNQSFLHILSLLLDHNLS